MTELYLGSNSIMALDADTFITSNLLILLVPIDNTRLFSSHFRDLSNNNISQIAAGAFDAVLSSIGYLYDAPSFTMRLIVL